MTLWQREKGVRCREHLGAAARFKPRWRKRRGTRPMLRLRALREDNRWRNVRYSNSSVVNTVVKTFESAFSSICTQKVEDISNSGCSNSNSG